jgi:hypothetical protein
MAKGPAGYCSIVCVTFPQGGVLSWRGMAAAGLLAAGPAGLGGAVGVEDEPPASSVNTDITVELTHQGAILRRGLTAVFLVAQVVQPFPESCTNRRQEGTGSEPPAVPGRQRSRRRTASQDPRAAPCRLSATAAYSEQLGECGQCGVNWLSSAW